MAYIETIAQQVDHFAVGVEAITDQLGGKVEIYHNTLGGTV
jgi:hypothetical protein